MANYNNQLALEEINLEKEKIAAETSQKEQIIEAKKGQSVQLIKANAIKQ